MTEENYHEVISELRERLAYLESELGLSDKAAIEADYRQALGLEPQEARALIALVQAQGRILSYAQLDDAMEREASGDPKKITGVRVYGIRKALGFDAIENIQGHGYRLTKAGRHAIELAHARSAFLQNAPVGFFAKA